MSFQLITDGLRITQGPNLTTALPSTFPLDAADGSANIYNQNYVPGWKKETLGWVKQGGVWKPEDSFMRQSGIQKRTQLYINNPSSVGLGTNTISSTPGNPTMSFQNAIGMSAYGGVIGYILKPGDPGYDPNTVKGIVAATGGTGLGNAIWGLNITTVAGTALIEAIGTGLSNTNLIVAAYGAGTYAAKLCRDYNGGGFTDWFMPSLGELGALFQNRSVLIPLGIWPTGVSMWSCNESWQIPADRYAIAPFSDTMGTTSGWDKTAFSFRYIACRYFTE